MTDTDPVARVLLPVLLHEVNNATQLLVGLRAILEIPGGEAMFHARADDLAKTSASMDDLGFALAVVATAGGANMLLARRDARSMQILWELAVKALTRSRMGARIEVVGEPPLTASSALDGWQLAWSVAALLIAANGDAGERLEAWTWEWSRDDAEVRLVGRLAGPQDGSAQDASAFVGAEVLERLNERLAPEASVTVDGPTVIWRGAASLFA